MLFKSVFGGNLELEGISTSAPYEAAINYIDGDRETDEDPESRAGWDKINSAKNTVRNIGSKLAKLIAAALSGNLYLDRLPFEEQELLRALIDQNVIEYDS